jgi:hypothetical protein
MKSAGMWKTLEAEEVLAPPQVQDQPAQPPKQNLVRSPAARDPVAKVMSYVSWFYPILTIPQGLSC